ncbi:pseudouridylate synthase 7 homolog [Montipora capricornis]|uniref:pseudouridylate synthase 7 homolog n=1 Tax=Montipora capricornis TaxID=246305 RepID=UPI0035F185DE
MADEAENLEPESKRARLSPEPNNHLGNVNDCNTTKESNVGDLQGIKVKENVEKTSSFPVDEADHTQSDEKKETGDGTSKSTFESSTVRPGVLKLVRVSDKDVGIFEFVSNLPGFHGVLKQRYTDFIVSERDPQGNLVRLTDVSVPQKEKTKEFHLDILSPEDREKIQQVIDEEEKNKSVILSPDDDKGHRTLVHRAIRENFSMLDSDTVDVGNQKAVRVFHKQDATGKQRKSRWPQELDNYCWFVLYKENKDTMDAINLLSKLLKIKTGIFGYAGTKDRRAVTTQWISVFRVRAEELQHLNSTLRNLCLGNFKYCKEPLKLGSLSGNHFVITLRSVVGDHYKIEEGLKSLKVNGFINYFGLQRFGTTSVPTHKIGLALLQSKWSEAIDLLLNPRDGEQDGVTAARQHWKETKNAKEALKKIPKGKFIESDLLQGLVRHGPSGLVNALQSISRNTRLMYVHAYQSYVWNFMATKRIKEYGLQPVKGDLVVASSSSADCAVNSDTSQTEDMVEFISEPSRTSVILLTDDHINRKQYTIHDVVLPLPGYDMIYPENSMKDHYRRIMADDGLDIDNMRRKVKDYSLSGAYRKLIVKPSLVSWQWLGYNDVKEPLALTDTDRMKGALEPQSVPDGKFWALKIEFTLPTSTYATMALREVLRCETSSAYQASLNQD